MSVVVAGPYLQSRLGALARVVLAGPVLALGVFFLAGLGALLLVETVGTLLTGRGSALAARSRPRLLAGWAGAVAYAQGLSARPHLRARGAPLALALPEERPRRREVLRMPGGLAVAGLATLVWLGTWPVVVLGWVWIGLSRRLPLALHVALASVLRYQVRALALATLAPVRWPGGLLGDPPDSAARRFGYAEGWPDVVVYAGVRAVWGYDATRLVCGSWPRPGAVDRADLWPLGDQQLAWDRFRQRNPDAVPLEVVGAIPAPRRAPWVDGLAARLVVLFAVFGLLGVGGGVTAAQQAATAQQEAVASRAGSRLVEAYAALDRAVGAYETATVDCRGASEPLVCVTRADGLAVAAFRRFAEQVADLRLPAAAEAARRALVDDAVLAQRAFGTLAQARSVAGYEAALQQAHLARTVDRVQVGVRRLEAALAGVS